MRLFKNIFVLFLTLCLFAGSLYASNAKLLFNGNCTVCHKTNTNKTAPSILEIKENYKRAYPLKVDFVNQMASWVNNPKSQTSIMLQSVEKFKIMPNLAYDIYMLKEIAQYIYDTDFQKSDLKK